MTWPRFQPDSIHKMRFEMKNHSATTLLPTVPVSGLLAFLFLSGCAVGPDYKRPTGAAPTQYKAEALGWWKEGQPLDHVPKGEWWEIFADDTLNDLQRRAAGANQELKAAVARVEQSRATARVEIGRAHG